MTLPKPEAGLVIRYSYLWADEHAAGHDEGRKDRPCAIILAVITEDGGADRVIVVPITHVPPLDQKAAMEIPATVKKALGLDQDRSWIVIAESNDFVWPGPDLRRIGDATSGPFAYGHLPSRYFVEVRRRFVEIERSSRRRSVPRTE